MDEREFHDKLSALQERVLSNALSEDEEIKLYRIII